MKSKDAARGALTNLHRGNIDNRTFDIFFAGRLTQEYAGWFEMEICDIPDDVDLIRKVYASETGIYFVSTIDEKGVQLQEYEGRCHAPVKNVRDVSEIDGEPVYIAMMWLGEHVQWGQHRSQPFPFISHLQNAQNKPLYVGKKGKQRSIVWDRDIIVQQPHEIITLRMCQGKPLYTIIVKGMSVICWGTTMLKVDGFPTEQHIEDDVVSFTLKNNDGHHLVHGETLFTRSHDIRIPVISNGQLYYATPFERRKWRVAWHEGPSQAFTHIAQLKVLDDQPLYTAQSPRRRTYRVYHGHNSISEAHPRIEGLRVCDGKPLYIAKNKHHACIVWGDATSPRYTEILNIEIAKTELIVYARQDRKILRVVHPRGRQ